MSSRVVVYRAKSRIRERAEGGGGGRGVFLTF